MQNINCLSILSLKSTSNN